jgi:hypothetical protein
LQSKFPSKHMSYSPYWGIQTKLGNTNKEFILEKYHIEINDETTTYIQEKLKEMVTTHPC